MTRTVLVTGATKGIGRAIVKQLCEQGYTVYATGRAQSELDSLREETGCHVGSFSLEDPDDVVRLYAEAVKTMGQVDVLVNNAGYSNNNKKVPVVEETVANFDLQMAINCRAPFILCREALRDMGARKSGHMVNIISTVALIKQENFSVYSATKYAIMGFTGSLAKEARPMNIKVTAVYPGGTDTSIRPTPRPEYMSPDSAAKMIVHCINAPPEVFVDEIVYRPGVEMNF